MTRRAVLRTAGIIMLIASAAAVGFYLFLTIQAGLAQYRLEREFEDYTVNPALGGFQSPIQQESGERVPAEPALPLWEEFPPTRLEIPALNLEVHVVAVDDLSIFARKLSHPPGYYPQSAFPGDVGNVLIAGHRDGPAGCFLHLDDLSAGDLIILHAPGVSYTYEVEKVWVVEPNEVEVIAPLDYAALTLTTCQRVGKDPAARRLIVRARCIKAAFSAANEGNGE